MPGILPNLMLAACLLCAVPIVTAHNLLSPTTPSTHVTPAPTTFYGTYAGGHVVPNGGGQATIAVLDAIFVPVGALVCQDLNVDLICGGVGELLQPFCGITVITDTTNGGPWVPAAPLFVYQDSTFVNCGSIGVWTFSVINHS